MSAIEANVEGCWVAKQTAKGSPASAPATISAGMRFRKVGGDMNVARSDGNENYSDGQRFSGAADFVNQIIGNGAPVVQGQASAISYLAYLFSGQETVTGSAAPYQHVATPNNAGSFWTTWWKRVGQNVVLRQKFNDCKIQSLRIEGSSGSKALHVTPTFLSLDAGELFTSDPVVADDGSNPLLYTEAEGTFTIDGTVIRGHSSFALVLNDNVQAWWGDSPVPYDVVYGQGQVMIEGVTLIVDAAGLAQYNTIIYGDPSPAAGTKPLTTVPSLGSYSFDVRRGSLFSIATTGTPTGGTWTPTVDGTAAAAVPYDATASALATILAATPAGQQGVTVTGGPGPGTPYVVQFAKGGVTITIDSSGLTGGTSPATTATSNGAVEECKIELPGVKWSPDLAIAGNPDGGAVEIALAAEARPVSGQPMYRITTRHANPAW